MIDKKEELERGKLEKTKIRSKESPGFNRFRFLRHNFEFKRYLRVKLAREKRKIQKIPR